MKISAEFDIFFLIVDLAVNYARVHGRIATSIPTSGSMNEILKIYLTQINLVVIAPLSNKIRSLQIPHIFHIAIDQIFNRRGIPTGIFYSHYQ